MIKEIIINAYKKYAEEKPSETAKARVINEIAWLEAQSEETLNRFAGVLKPANKYDEITPVKIVIGIRCANHTSDGYPI